MTDKAEQFISDKWQVSRQDLDTGYEITLTDRQWELLVMYLDHCEDTEESFDELHEMVSDLDGLEEFDKAYKLAWLEAHGNPYPINRLGGNVEESR